MVDKLVFEFEEVIEVKVYRDGAWHWDRATVVDPTSDPLVVELADGRHVSPKGGRVRRPKGNR